MVKKKSNPYITVSRDIMFSDEFQDMNNVSQLFYFYLNGMDNRFSQDNKTFYRSDVNIHKDTGMSMASIKRAKKELKRRGFIKITKEQKGLNEQSYLVTVYQLPETIDSLHYLRTQLLEEPKKELVDDIEF